MLSIKYIRENTEKVLETLTNKKIDLDINKLLQFDAKKLNLIKEIEALRNKRNVVTKLISEQKKAGKNSREHIIEMRNVSSQIKQFEQEMHIIDEKINEYIYYIPNIIHESVPIGNSEDDNLLVKEWGSKPEFKFTEKNHLEIVDKLSLIDFSRASKISSSGFPLYTDLGAKLERSLINFMIDHHTQENDYKEIFPPFLANTDTMQNTGQLPKFEEDMYKIDTDKLYCIPTAEVPVTNIHKGEVLLANDLPIKYAAYSACFRREAGSYGKETKGLLRLHQFNKVELVKFVNEQESYNELENLLNDAESVLQKLGLHYRIISLCSGDLSFSAAKCYDIEVWSPGEKKYLEVSSCSNFENFQSRRGNIRYRDEKDKNMRFVHTLNGSGLATPRLMVALLETYQNHDGTVNIPDVLQPYMNKKIIS